MLSKICELVQKHSNIEGLQDTAIPSVQIFQSSIANEKIHSVYDPSLCITVQGSKKLILENEVLRYSEGEFIFTSIDLPVCGVVTTASVEKPYLCLVIKIDSTKVFDLQKNMPETISRTQPISKAMYVGNMEGAMTDAVWRLVKCLDNSLDITILSQSIIREITYRLLLSENGAMIAQLGKTGSKTQKIVKAVECINRRFSEKLDMNDVANITGMSYSNFYKYFKIITGMSPLKYQKRIRLQEARQLLLSTDDDAATVSYIVGYESPSQFSREYLNFFGLPPKTDVKSMKKQ